MAATQAPSPESETTPQQGPTINSLAQFTKDLSFENPNAPNSLRAREGAAPAININVNVNATQVAPDEFNVELKLDGDAKIGTEVLFAFELVYGGLFRLSGIPPEQVHPVVMIECPRLLFPFARQIVADAVRHGGFPPLYIDPIDFVGLYNLTVQQQGRPNGQAAPEGTILN